MNITILRNGPRKNEVYFAAEYGEGKGIWNGNPVEAGEELEVEFELSRYLCAGWILCL